MPDGEAAAVAPVGEAEEHIEILDVQRPSLLDVVMQKAEDLGLVEKIQRVLIAGKYLKPADTGEAVKEMLDNAVRQTEDSDEDGGHITGLTIMLPGCFLSIIEGPQRLVIGTLRMLQEDHNSRYKELLASAHMFSSIQDSPGRSFPMYASRVLSLAKAEGMTPEKEVIVTLVPEMAINLEKFGHKLRRMDEGGQARELDSLQRKHAEHLPRVEDVLGLCASPDIMSLEEFFDLYYSPRRCLGGPLDTEICWPLPPTLSY
ncbi:hypothetical protein T484DRAFT_1959256 [Baffinella frigidus]|nr:hypothetical protein T484DRAFT_1959256 [Cryptophyta sp. CCMP2293]|mmetsp:Transcript_46285/g.110310  ORF Transcript_46285/g.110310 Transcript_46285/m.110310 type:complete len:259 (+) Transcript_46285:120-896(+)